MVHPRVQLRGSEPNPSLMRVLIHAPAAPRAAWLESELAHRSIVVQIGFSIPHVISALVDDPPPRPHILVVDFDALSPGAVMDLHALRSQGWFGRIFALGDLSPSLRSSLAIEAVLDVPLAPGTLRQRIIADTSTLQVTARMPVI
ncbi:MAG TPA: hypothetical protein VFP84_16175 [Kofleriaceae bacterium]|nr:hypothetical protein [Kofleriaceae bacterium]